MSLFTSIIGKLPESTSIYGKLNALDIKKTLRLALVVFTGAFCTQIASLGDFSSMNLETVFSDAVHAGVMALGSSVIELIRRIATGSLPS